MFRVKFYILSLLEITGTVVHENNMTSKIGYAPVQINDMPTHSISKRKCSYFRHLGHKNENTIV